MKINLNPSLCFLWLLLCAISIAGWLAYMHLTRPKPAPPSKIWKNAPYEFAIGIYTGGSPIAIAPSAQIRNPVFTAADITDFPACFVADPFVARDANGWYLFFEALNAVTLRGNIAVATSPDGLKWTYRQVVLDEPFHLSYPQVFQWGTNWYMLPEAARSGQVRLYRATEFPWKWALATNLLDGAYVDTSLLHHAGRWWLFATPRHSWKTLNLFSADQPTGPWKPHPCSPIIVNNSNIARPGGRMIVHEGTPIRYAQDADPTYANALHAFRITSLTPNGYSEEPVAQDPLLCAAGTGWNGLGMHQIDAVSIAPGQWRAYVDGVGAARPAHWTDAAFTNGIRLDGLSVRPAKVRAGQPVYLQFFWTQSQTNAAPLTAFAHFGRNRKERIFQFDSPLAPRQDYYETLITVPTNAPVGPYEVRMGLFLTQTGQKTPAKGRSCSKGTLRLRRLLEVLP